MRRIKIIKAGKEEVSPFIPHSFTQNEDFLSSIELLETLRVKSSKKAIRKLAEEKELSCDAQKIRFARKIINMMLDESCNGK
ncbi:MAG: hypothetical protein U9R26_09930 [Campylobacterota bacterium]|nr:hypothetical protein [Campylobacterota bacterium]